MAGSLTQRLAIGALATVAALAALASARTGSTGADATEASSRAVVVVDDGLTRSSYCIRFSGEIDGLDALRLAGAEAVVAGFGSLGGAVCSIDGTGCSASACLTCQAPRHWNYLRAPAGSGQLAMSPVGASSVTVRDGDVEAWVWAASASAAAAPSVDQACGPRPTTTTAPAATAPTPGRSGAADPAHGAPIPPPASQPPTSAAGADGAVSTTTVLVEPSEQSSPGGSSSEEEHRTGGEPSADDLDEPATEQAAAGAGSPPGADGEGGSWLGFVVGLAMVGGLGTWAVVLRRRSTA